jgi:hypothetical protein
VVDGRRKGNAYENAVARPLSEWLAPHNDSVNYRTCPVSSLLFRRRPADNDNIVTDWVGGRDLLHRPDLCFPFSVECKAWEVSFELHALFSTGAIWVWWNQAEEQARAQTRRNEELARTWPVVAPLLIFTKNRDFDYVVVPQGVAQCLNLKPHDGPSLTVDRPNREEAVVLLRLSDFVRADPARLPKLQASLREKRAEHRHRLALQQRSGTPTGSLRERLRTSSAMR